MRNMLRGLVILKNLLNNCTVTDSSAHIRLSARIILAEMGSTSVFARDSIYAIARICYRPSVRLSVCLSVRPSVSLSVTRVDQSKTVEVRIIEISPPGSPMTLVSS